MDQLSRRIGTLALLLGMATPVFAQQPAVAGRLKVVSGTAFIVRQNMETPAQVGQVVFEDDAFKTGADGRIGATLNDETRISIGPNSEVRLTRFMYAPADGRLGLALRFVRGVAAYVSGRIAKLSPDSIRLETPEAIIGIRGTRLAIRVAE